MMVVQEEGGTDPLPVRTPPALEVRRFHWPYIQPISLGEQPMSPAGTSSLGPACQSKVMEVSNEFMVVIID